MAIYLSRSHEAACKLQTASHRTELHLSAEDIIGYWKILGFVQRLTSIPIVWRQLWGRAWWGNIGCTDRRVSTARNLSRTELLDQIPFAGQYHRAWQILISCPRSALNNSTATLVTEKYETSDRWENTKEIFLSTAPTKSSQVCTPCSLEEPVIISWRLPRRLESLLFTPSEADYQHNVNTGFWRVHTSVRAAYLRPEAGEVKGRLLSSQ